MIFDYKSVPPKDRNAMFMFFEICLDQTSILEKYKRNGYYRLRLVHDTYSPYMSKWKQAYGIADGLDYYELVFPESSLNRFMRIGKEIKMWRNIQAIKKDF